MLSTKLLMMLRIKWMLKRKVNPAPAVENAIMFAIGLTIAFLFIVL